MIKEFNASGGDIYRQMKPRARKWISAPVRTSLNRSAFTCRGHRHPCLYRRAKPSFDMVNKPLFHLSINIPAGGIPRLPSIRRLA